MYYQLRVDFDYVSLKFTTTFNGEVLEPPYPIPTQQFHFLQNVTTDGNHQLYHFGFTQPGEKNKLRPLHNTHIESKFNGNLEGINPAPAVKTQLTYKCPENMRFSHAPNAIPTVKIHCLEDGTFTKPETWPVCISIQSKQAIGGI